MADPMLDHGNCNRSCWQYQKARFFRSVWRIGKKNADISVLYLMGGGDYIERDKIDKYFLTKLKITVIF